MNPRYTDFGEVEPSALHPTTQKELWNKGAGLDLFRLVNIQGYGISLDWGGGGGGGGERTLS